MNASKKLVKKEKLSELISETIKYENGVFYLTVTGTSMTPTLYSDSSSVALVSVERKPVRKYDIVLFKRDNGDIVLHRVIKILPDGMLLVNGDSQVWTEKVRIDNILAVVQSYTKNGRRIKCSGICFWCKSTVWCILRPLRPRIFRLSAKLKQFRKHKH